MLSHRHVYYGIMCLCEKNSCLSDSQQFNIKITINEQVRDFA